MSLPSNQRISSRATIGLQSPILVTQQREQPQTLHRFTLIESRATTPWLTVDLQSWARSSESTPAFHQGMPVPATIQVMGYQVKNIRELTLQITGALSYASDKGRKFLEHTVPIWSKRLEIPRVEADSPGASSDKLSGPCTWKISLPLPTEGRVEGSACSLPESLAERTLPVSVQYVLKVVCEMKGVFKSAQRIKIPFIYKARSYTLPLTAPHAAAYERKEMIPGPLENPDGWVATSPKRIYGCFESRGLTSIETKLHISKPATFARGTAIHIRIILKSSDTGLLALLSRPETIQVVLRRRIGYFVWPSGSQVENVGPTEHIDIVGKALWWELAPTGVRQSLLDPIKELYGEIPLSPDLSPTCEKVDHFSLAYDVALMTFHTSRFQLDKPANSDPFICLPLTIVTSVQPNQPKHYSLSPPAYESSKLWGKEEQQRLETMRLTYESNVVSTYPERVW